ncbi:MAG: winged helix DNA-binding domain-containing protein, partial [Chloroflexota bacterium]
MFDIPALRLRNQRLTGEPFPSAVEAVRGLGPVQAQDYNAALWALGQRTSGATEASLNRLFDDGAILRTHVMRPTWHFVLPEDVRWLLALTGPRIRRMLVARYRQLELDEDQIARAKDAFAGALAGLHFMTRAELGQVLFDAGLAPDGQRLPHFLMAAELDGVIVSGPRRGKLFTYALLEERVPSTPPMERTEAAVELASRYFGGHGPAQLQDFVWWSGLAIGAAKEALAAREPALEREVVEGKEYWLSTGTEPPPMAPVAHLLPNFDEYTVGYRDRADILDPGDPLDSAMFSFGNVLSNVLVIDGQVRGAWRRSLAGAGVRVDVQVARSLNRAEILAVEKAALGLGCFLDCKLDLRLP